MNNKAQFTPEPLHNVTGHRPGPWIRQVLNDESEAYVHDKHCNAIARVYSLSDAALIAAAPAMYEALVRLAEKVRRANSIQHGGGKLLAEDWAELYQITNESFGVIAQAEGR